MLIFWLQAKAEAKKKKKDDEDEEEGEGDDDEEDEGDGEDDEEEGDEGEGEEEEEEEEEEQNEASEDEDDGNEEEEDDEENEDDGGSKGVKRKAGAKTKAKAKAKGKGKAKAKPKAAKGKAKGRPKAWGILFWFPNQSDPHPSFPSTGLIPAKLSRQAGTRKAKNILDKLDKMMGWHHEQTGWLRASKFGECDGTPIQHFNHNNPIHLWHLVGAGGVFGNNRCEHLNSSGRFNESKRSR